jgi:hypothetical protein
MVAFSDRSPQSRASSHSVLFPVVVSRLMPDETLEALVAFVAEHQRCGDLDCGVDNDYVWLQCSCGGFIMHPTSEPPKAAPTPTLSPVPPALRTRCSAPLLCLA